MIGDEVEIETFMRLPHPRKTKQSAIGWREGIEEGMQPIRRVILFCIISKVHWAAHRRR